jgi:aryl-alcohol dehydrogenase-like predicted oxidoreductase
MRALERSALGTSSISVSRVIHGCMGFGAAEADAVRAIHAAFDAGVTSFDTAPLYGYGRSEELLGAALADRRDRVQILTKVGLRWDAAHGRVLFEAVEPDGRRRVVRRDSRPESIREEVERCLRRLRVDAVDLLQVHHRDADTPVAATMAALTALVAQGKVRAVGVSNFTVEDCREAVEQLGAVPLATVQDEYNLIQRRIERDVLPWAASARVGVLAYSPLAQGVLAGRQLSVRTPPPDWRAGGAYFAAENLRRVHAALERSVLPIARAHGVAPATVSLAWLLGRPGLTAVIAGASSADQARANAAAASLALTDDERRRLDESFLGIVLAPPPGPTLVGRGLRKVRRVLSRVRARLPFRLPV